jgi:hypothetical protein
MKFFHFRATFLKFESGVAAFWNPRDGLVNHVTEHARRAPNGDIFMQVAQADLQVEDERSGGELWDGPDVGRCAVRSIKWVQVFP